ncbi:MAG: hypothetical protein R3179_11540, partial [Sedimenticolaceae bacterium]|nr:hypothetical protein [Sedimenticolaceae bacterium]
MTVKQRNRRPLLFVAVAAILVLAAWFSLPALLRGSLGSMLDEAGYVLETFDLHATGLTETRIERVRVTAEDGSLFEIDGLLASYSPAGLLSGDLARIQVDSLLIGSSSQRQPLAKLLQGLVSLMEQDWRESIPVSYLRIEKFRLALAPGKEIGGELTLEKVDQ